MREILRNWIQARLGIMIDFTPTIFGYYTRDGKLLAEILHSYDIINRDQLDTLVDTHDPALCRVNLKHLRVWLRFLGVDCNNESIEEISCGKGTTSLRLFYKVYLSLESKDRLHFITLQKEREKFVPDSKKFEVTTVSEDPPPYQPSEHPLSRKLVEGKASIDWHRAKFPVLLRKLKRDREMLEDCKPYPIVEPIEHNVAEKPQPVSKRKEESEELDRFARKHRSRIKTPEELEEKQSIPEEVSAKPVLQDPEMAKVYIDWLKCRSKRAATMNALKTKMQKALLSELWERIAEEQEKAFDRAIASRVLDQSRYEKQMVTKLCEVREQKNIMAENQKILDDMTLETNETEYRASIEREKDLASRMQKDVEIECQRMCELRRRLREKKIQKIKKKHWRVCREAVEDLLDLALKIAIYRETNEEHVPRTMLREWETLFLRCQSIFDEDISYDMEENIDEQDKEDMLEEVSQIKLEKIEALQDALFDDYHEANSPWDEFLPMLAEDAREMFELGRRVLGYVAHRLLNYLRTDPTDPSRSKTFLSKFHRAAIILGVANPTVHETIRTLLENNQIRLVRMEDAINYCLERYKNEMSDVEYIDLNVITATDNTVAKLQKRNRRLKSDRSGQSRRFNRGSSRRSKSSRTTKSHETEQKKSENTMKKTEEQESKVQEKETQTPRNIPYDDMDPVLTDAAYIGKWTYEYLTLGEPIANELAVKILIEYLKSLSNATGWALIDYPNTYEQMSLLEEALTGSNLPPNPDSLDFEDVTVEDVESITPRIVFEESVDPSTLYRHSRIVPDPIKRTKNVPPSRLARVFVRVVQKPKNFEIEERSYETLKPDTPSVDKFYASQNIAYLLYYSSLDLTTLKRLARLVIGEPLQRQSSGELFGNVLKSSERVKERSAGSKAPVVRRLLTESIEEEFDGEREEEQDLDRYNFPTIEMELGLARPGEENWEWIQFPLPSVLVPYLASLWEGLETMYIDGLKELLLLKSVHLSGIVSYKSFVTKAAVEFVNRPHNNQDLLHDFHKAFNDIDEDARNDADVKCELHRRVADFQAQLWEICDQRRLEAEEERKRFIDDQWTVFEATILFNVYVGIIQTEMDRYIDTMRVLQDYYLGMIKRPLQEVRFSKVVLNKMKVPGAEDADDADQSYELLKPVEKLTDRKETNDRSRVKGGSLKSAAPSPPAAPPLAIEYAVLREEMNNFLLDRNKPFNDTEAVCIFKTIVENVRYARSIVDAIAAVTNEILVREEAAASKSRDYPIDLIDSIDAKQLASRVQDSLLEWRYAIGYEIGRIRLRLDSLIAASRSDIIFLLETMQQTFHQIYDSILDRYWREMKSVNEMANVFCLAIEEARPLEREMLLDGDRFVVRSNVFVLEVKREVPTEVKEADSSSQFRIAQLSQLMEIFRQVAPYGTMAERTIVYILEDLVCHGMEEGESVSLPCCWYRLRSTDISRLVGELYEFADHVDWREFIVYAMDLPMPTCRDILIARDRFRIQDSDLKEVVTCAQFLRTPLWFLDCTEMFVDAYEFLRDDFHRNIEDLYEEELYHLDRDESNDWSKDGSSIFSLKKCCNSSKKRLRLILAKELLCRMYMISRHTINYTALLLAFCKDENPREGFGKALALALGNRVCTDLEEGERYVEELYEKKRQAREARFLRKISDRETFEATKEIINYLVDRVETIGGETLENPNETEEVPISKAISSNSDGIDREGLSLTSSLIVGEEEFQHPTTDQELVIYWLPLDVCLTVLAAALPCHTFKPDLLGTSKSLRDRLTLVYQELRDDDLSTEKNVVLAHRLLNHDFVKRLLSGTSKFTLKNMRSMIQDILRARENAKFD